jgi:hypothetical protein
MRQDFLNSERIENNHILEDITQKSEIGDVCSRFLTSDCLISDYLTTWLGQLQLRFRQDARCKKQ